jgi:hypothetical protein
MTRVLGELRCDLENFAVTRNDQENIEPLRPE